MIFKTPKPTISDAMQQAASQPVAAPIKTAEGISQSEDATSRKQKRNSLSYLNQLLGLNTSSLGLGGNG